MSKEIPLSRGKVAIVDDEDFDFLNQRKWYYSSGFAVRDQVIDGRRRTITMARLLVDFDSKIVYLNGNKLDYRKCNLGTNRTTTQSPNAPDNSVYIPLSKGLFALIDQEDFERVNQYSWYAQKSRDLGFYAVAYMGGGRKDNYTEFLHRFISNLNPSNKEEVDHINGNKLDCRKENLRICHKDGKNVWNRPKPRCNTSGYKGVSWSKSKNKWRAYISLNRKQISLGHFETKEEAARAYNQGALKYHKEFSHLNEVGE